MTARSLTGNFSKFGTYYLYKLRSLRSMIILNSIFALLSYPLAFGIAIPTLKVWEDIELYQIQTNYRSSPKLQELYVQGDSWQSLFIASVVIGCIMLGMLFVMNFVVTNKAFRWLYKKSIVDMDYSLPVSGDTRFCGDLLATLTTALGPHLVAIGTGLVLFQFWPKGDRIESASGVQNEAMILLGNIIPQLMFTGFIASIMLIALTLFVMSLCGRPQESRLYPAVFNVVIPVVLSVCIGIVISNTYGSIDGVYGFSGESLNSYTAVASTSPFGLLLYTLIYTFDTQVWSYGNIVYTAPILRPEIIIPLIIITLALLVGAYFLVRNRRAERVGSAFVYGAMKFVIPALVIFSVVASFSTYILGSLFPNSTFDAYYSSSYYGYYAANDVGGYVIAMLIVTFVLYVIMELISGKGFKRFHITLLKYVVTVGGSFLICMGLFFSNGMGAGYYVPNSNDVVSAYVGLHDDFEVYGSSIYGEVKLPENIKAVVDIHNDIPKNGPEIGAYGYSFNVNYNLKDGTTLSRYYFITEERYNEAREKLFSAELYASSELPSVITDIPTEGTSEFTSLSTEKGSFDCRIPATELRDALLKDCEKVTPELMYDPTKRGPSVHLELKRTDTVGDRSTRIRTDLELYAWYDNTIALLERHGVTGLFDVDTSQFETAYFVKIDRETAVNNPDVYNYSIEPWYIATCDEPTEKDYLLAGFEDVYSEHGDEAQELIKKWYIADGTDVVAVPIDSDIIEELYKHSFKDYYSGYDEDVIYRLVLSMYAEKSYGVSSFFISEDYIDRAEEIFKAHK